AQSKKIQKFLFRSALQPNQISFSHGLGPERSFMATQQYVRSRRRSRHCVTSGMCRRADIPISTSTPGCRVSEMEFSTTYFYNLTWLLSNCPLTINWNSQRIIHTVEP